MEEKLRNLSQNIAANTGDEHKPRIHHPDDDAPKESESDDYNHRESEEIKNNEPQEENHEADHEEPKEDVSDYTPELEDHNDEPEEHHDESEEHHDELEENHEETQDEHHDTLDEPTEETTEDVIDNEEKGQPEEHNDEEQSEDQNREGETEEEEPAPAEPKKEEPKILSMTPEGEAKESPVRTKKYSPEVEAALNRLKADDVDVDFTTEPLSTEPRKQHHGGRIFLLILLIIAIAAIAVCILVEQGVIDNPLDMFSKKTPEPAAVAEVDEGETELTDRALIKSIDTLFATTVHVDDNYYIYSRNYQKLNNVEYVYYDVAEPAREKNETPSLSGELTDTVTSAQTDCIDSPDNTTDCLKSSIKIDSTNYKDFPHYRYIFVKNSSNTYEFQESHLL